MESVDFNNMRRAMVDSQLRTSGVTSAWVLAAMGRVAREDFVSAGSRDTAYMDRVVPLGGGRGLNPPVAAALMLEAAEIGGTDRVLLIGAATGYLAALVAAQAAAVVAVEEDAALAAQARGNLAAVKNATLVEGPLIAGAATQAPYSLVLIDGAIEMTPDALLAQAAEGARVVTGTTEHGVTRLATGYVNASELVLRPFADTEIAALPGFAKSKEFVF